MNTKFDMNQKVRLVGIISGIHTDERGTKYVISVHDGCSDYNSRICITEKILTEMNKEESDLVYRGSTIVKTRTLKESEVE